MTKSHLSIGRMVAAPIDEIPISNSESQEFKVPAVLSGVSREHASISWNEKDLAFQILVKGRNGALINRRRLNFNEISLLSTRQTSAIALGKSCFIYFAPAMPIRKSSTPVLIPPSGEESAHGRKSLSSMRWQPAVIREFQRRKTFTIDLHDLLASLATTYPDQCETSNSWRASVKKLVRKAPFSFVDSNQTVCLHETTVLEAVK